MNTKNFFHSITLKFFLGIIALIVLLLGIFSLGEHIGFHKASFAFQNSNNFYRTFGPSPGGPLQPSDFSDDHGAVGKIISITLPTMTIEDKDNTEKIIVLSNQTIIKQFRNTLNASDLAVGDYVIVIGQPNSQSQIVAVLVRVLPS